MLGHLLGLGEAAHLRDVGGDDASRLLLDQLAIALLAIEVLARADRRPRAVRDMALRLDVLGRDRVLEPKQIKGLERLGQPDRVIDAELPVRVHRHHDLGPHRLADGADHLHHPAHLERADRAVEGLEPAPSRMRVLRDVDRVGIGRVEVELDGGEALGHHLPGLLRIVGGIGRLAGVAVGIDADPVPEPAAEEGRGRRLEGLAQEVPKGDLDAADRGDGGAGLRAFARQAADHHLDEPADIDRILADQKGLGLVHQLGHARTPIGLAEPADAGVGLDPDQHPGKIPLDDRRAYPRNLHERNPPWSQIDGNASAPAAPDRSGHRRDADAPGRARATPAGRARGEASAARSRSRPGCRDRDGRR